MHSPNNIDFDFSLDIDHRKRRRNRTTQSCLNCHTSKRKVRAPRPRRPPLTSCSATGNARASGASSSASCVPFPVPALVLAHVPARPASASTRSTTPPSGIRPPPALSSSLTVFHRDDPNLDEITRLRNRIAELESLVRELRGKPHPRWADANFCDGDPSEKWHSRASKRPQPIQLTLKPRRSFDAALQQQQQQQGIQTPIKSEPAPDLTQHFPYRFTPSPSDSTGSPYAPYPSTSYPDPYADPYAGYRSSTTTATDPPCTCLTNPAAGHPLLALVHQLQSSLDLLRALPEHQHEEPASPRTTSIALNDPSASSPASSHGHLHPTNNNAASGSRSHPHLNNNTNTHNHNRAHAHTDMPGYAETALSTPPESDVLTPLSAIDPHHHHHHHPHPQQHHQQQHHQPPPPPHSLHAHQQQHDPQQQQQQWYNPYFPALSKDATSNGGGVRGMVVNELEMEMEMGIVGVGVDDYVRMG
ncbi:hypothetical protein EW146_g8494 [Bondarzewia mesenterica]|uniref:Uncharacterized protein n=1 Tax=Bondarzewia mesenterica TaxID=1095465 RepID=A0A4S4LDX2_9AGAM|nr:hypothetical protein EW146_g8494 [Bondarzewia mesenterica]